MKVKIEVSDFLSTRPHSHKLRKHFFFVANARVTGSCHKRMTTYTFLLSSTMTGRVSTTSSYITVNLHASDHANANDRLSHAVFASYVST